MTSATGQHSEHLLSLIPKNEILPLWGESIALDLLMPHRDPVANLLPYQGIVIDVSHVLVHSAFSVGYEYHVMLGMM